MNEKEKAEKLYRKAKEFFENEDYENARKLLKKVVELDPKNGFALQDLAFAHRFLDFKYKPEKECWKMLQRAEDLKRLQWEERTGQKLFN